MAPLLVEFDIFADRGGSAKQTVFCGGAEDTHRCSRSVLRGVEKAALRDAEMADYQVAWLDAVNDGRVLLRLGKEFSRNESFARGAILNVGHILANDLVIVEGETR